MVFIQLFIFQTSLYSFISKLLYGKKPQTLVSNRLFLIIRQSVACKLVGKTCFGVKNDRVVFVHELIVYSKMCSTMAGSSIASDRIWNDRSTVYL